jgi:hypothetical protein
MEKYFPDYPFCPIANANLFLSPFAIAGPAAIIQAGSSELGNSPRQRILMSQVDVELQLELPICQIEKTTQF